MFPRIPTKMSQIKVHRAFREVTTGFGSELLKVLRDTERERENGKLEKI